MIKNVYTSLRNIPVILVRFLLNFNFLDRYFKNPQMLNFKKVLPMGAELFHADWRTDKHDEANSRFSQFIGLE